MRDVLRRLALSVISEHAPRQVRDATDDTNLSAEWWLNAAGLHAVIGDLEAELATEIHEDDVLDLALDGPTLGRLLDLLERHAPDEDDAAALDLMRRFADAPGGGEGGDA